jgi:hypothetical protein
VTHRAPAVAVLGAAALAIGLSAPAGAVPSKEVSPERWARSVCSSLTDWIDEIEDLASDVGTAAGDDIDEAQELLVDFLDDAVKSTNGLLKRLNRAGTPDVEDGGAIARTFKRGFKDAREIFADGRDAAEDLSTDDPGEFATEAAEIGTAIDEGSSEVSDVFDEADDKYETEKLDEAFQDEEACADFA